MSEGIFAAAGLEVVLGVVLAIGCATSTEARGGAAALPAEDVAGASAEEGATAAVAVAVPAETPVPCSARVGADRLRRSAVKRTVDAGLGRWLQTVSVDPLLARGRFKGWIVRSLNPADSCYTGVDVHTGDVITRVNGRGIEHPEEALEVWSALPASQELVIDLVRDGQPRTVRFGIVDP